jgi:hypothetical protein
MVPTFRLMQERIDVLNTTLREQITGIRSFARSSARRTRSAGSTTATSW